jgi:hypothetical protein
MAPQHMRRHAQGRAGAHTAAAPSPSTAYLASFQLAGLGSRLCLCLRRREHGGRLGETLWGARRGAAGRSVEHLRGRARA